MRIRDLFKKWWFWVIVFIVGFMNWVTQLGNIPPSIGGFAGSMVGAFLILFALLAAIILIIAFSKFFLKLLSKK